MTIDTHEVDGRPHDPRIRYIRGDSTSDEVLDEVHVASLAAPRMVILDSDHSGPHVLKELERYAYLVSPGSYLIVEDSNLNGHPAMVEAEGGGPTEALRQFLGTHPEFEPDLRRERFGVTFNPGGWLRRI